MGSKLAKQGPGKVEDLSLHNHLINCLSNSFYLRNLVSKQRRRMLVAGYDLDMSYITDRVLAMSFPAEHMRAMYRNPLWQVQSVLEMRHQEHYKSLYLKLVAVWVRTFFHSVITLYQGTGLAFICSLKDQAGKGRTGLMVCAYLVYTGMSADEALQLYADRRTTNNEGMLRMARKKDKKGPIVNKCQTNYNFAMFNERNCAGKKNLSVTKRSCKKCIPHCIEQVSIPSQRRYVRYWERVLSSPTGIHNELPDVILPEPCSRELRRIRLHDLVNVDTIFFVVTELQEMPDQLYRPSVELARSCCREINKGYQRSNSPQYYLSFTNIDEEGKKSQLEEHVVVQMDTESSIIYQKTCLDHYFEKPLRVTGDVRIIFYQKMFGGRLFYCCFNTAFIKSSLLQLPVGELDKVGKNGRSICGPAFCLELLFGPANAKHSSGPQSDDGGGSHELF
ncbi:Phosphatidylinositol 3,4,5-trisphosphate 3-phosphatase and dual-specificity protein phosphatase PTEN [Morella rubra]|uniref:Phosphatidylinositol 3,4,5-trisphosphate 3-phosphatase and dual-specificity protein phosphatase PTEN n=1 Tax=Morella rubra TaxID=262757 RepID=A0A6A1VHY2_9ROSI|nr:Phosphatidylinositol 3,4,5-trisphosphate 3-phosphatase and dual-specificity protein phosphatase PTEN [Morella rubra]